MHCQLSGLLGWASHRAAGAGAEQQGQRVLLA